MDRYIGRMLDNRYEILDIIGSGGMAVVYKARCCRLNRLVAIKILKDENLSDEEYLRRFHAESQAVARMSHPNIVSVYDVSSSSDQDYIVMELIDGITLKEYIRLRVCLNWRQTVHFATNIAKALEHAHSKKIVHRDIKPQNVMVLANGAVKVADFGIARMMESNSTMTKEAIGSVDYISPEQAKGRAVDHRSDIYSLGVVMYEMITGKTPYEGESPVAVAIKHINGGAARPSTLVPNLPRGLEQIIMKAMATNAADRYADATAMLRDLEEFRKQPGIIFADDAEPKSYHPRGTGVGDGEGLHLHTPEVYPEPGGTERRKVAPRNERIEEDRDSSKGKVAIAAVIICSIAAVVAIIVFMILLTRQDMESLEHRRGGMTTEQNLSQTQQTPQIPQTPQSQQILQTMQPSQSKPDEPPQTSGESGQAPVVPDTTGAAVQLMQMENLVSKTREEAEAFLNLREIVNVQWVSQESMEPAGTVIGQSVAPGHTVGENEQVIIILAAGAVSKNCTFSLPFRTEEYYLTVLLDGRPVVLERKMSPQQSSVTLILTGKGRQTCELYIDGVLYQTVGVDFDADA